MKTKLAIVMVIGMGIWGGNSWAQTTNTPAQTPAEAQAPAPAEAPTKETPPSPPLIVEAPKPGEMPSVDTNAPVVTNLPPVTATTNTTVEAGSAAGEGSVIYDEAPLLVVITALARQARINFQFDPVITTNLSAVGPDGKPGGQPLVSLRLENVTAEQVLEAVLDNYGYSLVQDPRTKIGRITLKPAKGLEPQVTRVIQLKYSSVTNMMLIVKGTISTRGQVVADGRTSQLVVLATEKEHEELALLLKQLDTPIRQVLIEARLLETSQSPQAVRGIDWSGTLEAQRVSFGNNGVTEGNTSVTPASSATTTLPSGRTIATITPAKENTILSTLSGTVKPLTGGLNANTAGGFAPAVGFLSADGASAVLSFLNKDADTEVVATPRAVTLDNETATLSVTRAYPIFKITPGSANSPAGAEILYTNLGTILTVTPRISGDNNIALRVVPEVSNIDSKDQQTVNGQINQANIYAIRKIETHVMIPSGNTLVMGGLISDSKTKSYVKVPILGDLPGIGLLFRQDSKKRIKQNLLIFITPTIIQDNDYNVIKNDFLKVKQGDRDRLLKSEDASQESPWNSGKPVDWSKPAKQED